MNNKARRLVRRFYTGLAGIGLIAWVFSFGGGDSNDSTLTPGFGFSKAHADTPSCASSASSQNSDSSACSSGCGASGGGDGGDGSCGCTGCGNSACCFLGDAQVATENGVRAIKDLAVGNVVRSYDESTGAFTTSRIARIFAHSAESGDAHNFQAHPLMEVVCDDGRTVLITANHPVLNGSTNEYVPISTFVVGDTLVIDGGTVKIDVLRTVSESEYFQEGEERIVYNLELTDGPHTYIVEGIVVHNKDSDGGSDCL